MITNILVIHYIVISNIHYNIIAIILTFSIDDSVNHYVSLYLLN